MKRQQSLPPFSGYYAPLPGMANSSVGTIGSMMPGAPSMTPPPSLTGSDTNISVGKFLVTCVSPIIVTAPVTSNARLSILNPRVLV